MRVTTYAGRRTAEFSDTVSIAPRYSRPVRVSSIIVQYDDPAMLTLTVTVTLDGVSYVRHVNELGGVSSYVLNPTSLWLRPGDSISFTNSVSASATVVVDFEA
jgi:hypothetical protein